jgi:hypothetical protein
MGVAPTSRRTYNSPQPSHRTAQSSSSSILSPPKSTLFYRTFSPYSPSLPTSGPMIPPIPLHSKRFSLRLAPVFNVSTCRQAAVCLGVASSRSVTAVSVNCHPATCNSYRKQVATHRQMRQPKDYDKAVSFLTDLHDRMISSSAAARR